MSQNINISIENFNNLCRTCSQSNDLISIHENNYLIEMLATSVQIQVQLTDELPTKICLNCIKILNQCYAFINKCRSTDAAFKHCLTQQKLLNLQKPPEKPEVSIKTEISDIEDLISSDSDEISIKNQEFEEKREQQTNINNYVDVCSNCNKSFASNMEFVSHLNDCQFSLIEPIESSDDESHGDPLDVTTSTIPEKSRMRYKRERILFLTYCKQNNFKEFTEDVVFNYYLEKSKTMKPSSLWSSFSMLKNTLSHHDDVDISKYRKLSAFLKRTAVGYKAKVSKTFTKEEVNKFLHEAPDEKYLMMKVALIMGIAGGCHRDELLRMSLDHIDDKDSVLIVSCPIPKTNKARTFLITNHDSDWIPICRKYFQYRMSLHTEHRRLFVNYKNGRYSNIPAGRNNFMRFPKLIAEFLNLPGPGNYTGHCFRRTSALVYNKRGIWKSAVIDGDDF